MMAITIFYGAIKITIQPSLSLRVDLLILMVKYIESSIQLKDAFPALMR